MGSLRIGLVAGEPSGDLLAARVVASLRAMRTDLTLEGIGGPGLAAQGLDSLYPMERLSVMGLVEPLQRLPELLRLRARLRGHFLRRPPDVFLGVDSPDFNLPLARSLRRQGIQCAQLVSPTVWAWRPGRVRGIGQSVDELYCLFPFEPEIYRARHITAHFVGHPLADDLAPVVDTAGLREALGLPRVGKVLALLPGSREAEVSALAGVFFATAKRLCVEGKVAGLVLPVANAACQRALEPWLKANRGLPLTLLDGNACDAISAADAVLTASGTAALEAALLRRPMVVAYRTGRLSWAVLSRLVRTPHIALPNILARQRLVPELLQHDVTPHKLYQALLPALRGGNEMDAVLAQFDLLRDSLRGDFAATTAAALSGLAGAD